MVDQITREIEMFLTLNEKPTNIKTKACNNVVYNNQKKSFTSCQRSYCTFAHTLEELQVMKCKFGDNCNNFYCQYIHPFETKKSYFTRTGKSVPALPEKEISQVVPIRFIVPIRMANAIAEFILDENLEKVEIVID